GDDHKMCKLLKAVRQYGKAPWRVVMHQGGPGGAGEAEPFARELGHMGYDVLEPFQTRQSVGGQVDELRSQIEQYCEPPVLVIGWSWGAWLGCLLAAQHEDLVRALILVGSGPLEARYTEAIRTTKKVRLSDEEQAELLTLRSMAESPTDAARFIELSDMADTYSRDTSAQPNVVFDEVIHKAVWPEADGMRKDGSLLEAISTIRCPVLAIHGDYDPRPSEGVRLPLQAALPSAEFVEIKRCGHKPWQEIYAKDEFYRLVEKTIT
ncbi:alpha/beta fold hydrolase, partial [Ruegeria halocynthiae]|uniref:alpha/beta fold hydrolase n=2 Tax=Ruegeria halocynthiae TaxID=985054 RepID=UPI001267B05E